MKQTVSNWESNTILPSIEKLISLAQIFNVSTDYLLDISTTRTIDVSSLTNKEIAHIDFIIQDIKHNKKYTILLKYSKNIIN